MKKTERKQPYLFLLAGIVSLALSNFFTPEISQAFDISVNISPNIINLESTGHTFGIHTTIPYSDVNIAEVVLRCPNDHALDPTVCFADSLGNLVVKFNTSDLEAGCDLVINDYNILVLEGETKTDPELFSGAGEVLIIESRPKFKKENGLNSTRNNLCRSR